MPGKILDGIQVFVAFHEDSDLLMYYKEQSNRDFLHQKNFDLCAMEILMSKADTTEN